MDVAKDGRRREFGTGAGSGVGGTEHARGAGERSRRVNTIVRAAFRLSDCGWTEAEGHGSPGETLGVPPLALPAVLPASVDLPGETLARIPETAGTSRG